MKASLIKIFLITIFIPFLLSQSFADVLKVGKEYQFKNIEKAFDVSVDGDTVLVFSGRYQGNFEINKSLILIGKDNPVIDANNEGTIITIEAPDVELSGFIIQNSGILLNEEDAGILVKANNVIIKGNYLRSVLFGIYLRQADSCIVKGNYIEGKKELDIPRRGDLFRAWYSKNLLVEDNKFQSGRDVIIWFSENTLIKDNEITNARYGIHYMYSSNSKILNNILTGNSVGMYLMYSKELLVENNLLAYNRGASGFGIGLKDLDNVELRNNVIADNRVGIFIDNSPRNFDTFMKYNNNVIAYNETGVDVLSTLENSYFKENSLIENYEQTSLTRTQDPDNDYWTKNYWSDYAGYDKNNDGIGDIQYRSEELFAQIIEDKPNLKIFLYSPAINTLDYASKAFPILTPEPGLIDKSPLLKPVLPENIPSLKIKKESNYFLMSLLLTIFPAGLLILFRYRNKLVHRSNNSEEFKTEKQDD